MRRPSIDAEIAAKIDATVSNPVLVLGDPAQSGQLDLLANPEEYDIIAKWLAGSGFLRWRQSWAKFDEDGVSGVSLSATKRWLSAGGDLSVLFEDSEAIPGLSNLVRPGPATVLLIGARDMIGRRGLVSQELRHQVSEALDRDPEAWALAERRAPAIGMVGALRLLRRACGVGQPLPPSARVAGLAGALLHGGPVRAKAEVFAEAFPRRWRPAVVSFSGLDGSGKSTQVTQLQDTLALLGASAELQWAGFKTGSSIRSALPVLDRSLRTGARGAQPATTPPRERDPLVPAACLGHPLGEQLWTFTVVAVNAINLWRHVLKPRRGAEVLIFDRFSPDSSLKLDFHYGCNRHIDIRRQRALFTFLSPKPDVGFLVAVPAVVAHQRRQEQTLDELTVMARLYDDQESRFGLVRLDGTEPADQLGRFVVKAAWEGMR